MDPEEEWKAFCGSIRHLPFEAMQYRRVAKLLRAKRELFLMAYRDNPIVAHAMTAAAEEGLREEDAWLLAVIGLLEQNRSPMHNARANVSAPVITKLS